MSFNALSLAKIGVGFGALAVATIGLLSPTQVEAGQYIVNPTIILQQRKPTYVLLPKEMIDVTMHTWDAFLFDATAQSYISDGHEKVSVRTFSEDTPARDQDDHVFACVEKNAEPVLQVTRHTSLLHVNKPYTICQTQARDLWLLFKNL